MIPEVFEANLLIEPVEEGMVRGLYRPDSSDPDKKAPVATVRVVGVGQGYLIPEKGEWMPLPYKVGDYLVVLNGTWIDFSQDDEKYYLMRSDKVLARITPNEQTKEE